MNILKPNDIHSAIIPLYYFSRLLGLASYKFEKPIVRSSSPNRSRNEDSGRQFGTCKCAVLYSTLVLLALLGWLVYYLVMKILHDFVDVKVTYIVTQVMTLCLSAATTMISLGLELTINRKRMEKVMLKLYQVDKILNMDSNSAYKSVRHFVMFELVLSVILLVARHGYELWSRGGQEYSSVVVRFIIHIMSTIMIVQFVTFIYILKQRFGCMNDILADLGGIDDRCLNLEQGKLTSSEHRLGISSLNDTSVLPQTESTPISHTHNPILVPDTEISKLHLGISPSRFKSHCLSQGVSNIHTLSYVHMLLYDIGQLVNLLYGLQVLLAMAYVFMSVVKYFHVVLMTDDGPDHEEKSVFKVTGVVALVCTVSIHVANLLWVTAACNMACSEAHRTAVVINKLLLIQPLAAVATAELQLFSQQLLHSKLQFTAFGFFNLDFTFLYGFVGGTTTYIVILLQFQ